MADPACWRMFRQRETSMPETNRNALREITDVNDAASIMTVSNPTIWRWIPGGDFPKAAKIGGQNDPTVCQRNCGVSGELEQEQ